MFWGITLDAGKRYTQTVEKSFHLSMAALGFQNCSSTPVTVMVEVDKAQFAICTLQPGKIPQQPLDYCFTEGEEITLYTEGAGDVHLTGYLIEEPNALEFEDEEISDASEESDSVSESSCSESDESGSPSREMNFGDLLHDDGKMNVGNGHSENATSDDEDDDWDPTKENPKRQKKSKKDKKPKHLKEKSEESNDDKEQLVMDLFRDSDVSDDDLFDEDYGHSSLEEENKSRIKQVNKLETNKKWKKCKLKVGETEGKEATESDYVGKIKLPSKKQNRKPKHLKEKSEESSDDKEQLVMDLFRDSDVSDDDLFDEDYDRWSLEEENKSRIKQVNKLETNKKGKKRKLKVDETEGKEATGNDNVGKITLPSKKQKRKNKRPPKATDGPSIEQAAQSDKGAVNSSLNVITNSSEKLNSPSRKDSSKDVKETPTVEVKSPQEIQQKSHQKQSNKKKLPGGTVVEDITKGQGKIAKKGHKVSVYYKGTLSKNKKQFDACLSGKPFNFRLGVGEVIRGWDLGVEGMQVGGKRKLIVPPSQGYGSEKTGPIPPDSTLEFEIQLMRLK